MSISDPDNPYRYLEVRGVVEEVVPDPTGAFCQHLNDRYSGPTRRVILHWMFVGDTLRSVVLSVATSTPVATRPTIKG